MGFKIKNSLTGEFEKLPILTLKGEKGETGGVEEYNKVDYMGNKYETLKQANDANVEYAVKTAIGEFNYLDYEGQHITATETIAGQAKNATLTGQTLVNLVSNGNVEQEIGHSVHTKAKYRFNKNMINQNKEYLLLFDVSNLTDDIFYISFNNANETGITYITNKSNGIMKVKVNFSNVQGNIYDALIIFHTNSSNKNPSGYINDVMLIEYRDGMENWDIPFFEGMQSVKMPVLHTVGKNLFDEKTFTTSNEESKYYSWNNGQIQINALDGRATPNAGFTYDYVLSFKKNDEITFSSNPALPLRIINLTTNTLMGSEIDGILTYTVPEDSVLGFKIIGSTFPTNVNVQLEKGSIATPYEPYKSNSLSTPEDLELRGIGNVKDTLDISTGEVVERIGEVVLDGSEGWWHYKNVETMENTFCLSNTIVSNILGNGVVISNSYSNHWWHEMVSINPDKTIGNANNKAVYIIDKSCSTLEEFTNYLQQRYINGNPVIIQYPLSEKSVKTVDLSDNHVYSYKGTTHYDCSSAEGSLVPTLSVKVPTDVQATIAQQRKTIQTLNSENERLNQIQEALKASMLDSQVQLMNLSWDTDFEVFTLRESIAPKDFLLDSRTGSNIDKFSQAKFIIENDCPDLEKLNSQIEYYFSKDVFSQEQFEELTDLISIVKGGK